MSRRMSLLETLEGLGYGKTTLLAHVGGGIVNAGRARVYRSDTGKIFVKSNDTAAGQKMFECEFESLKLLRKVGIVRTPEPFKLLDDVPGEGTVILTEYLEGLAPIEGETIWRQVGEQIAKLHRHNPDLIKERQRRDRVVGKADDRSSQDVSPVKMFGFHKAHFFGPDFHVPADIWEDDWASYFCRHLMDPLVQQCVEQGERSFGEIWSSLQRHAHKPFVDCRILPSLLHGDLFQINMGCVQGVPVVFDPQSWYGHWEFELSESFPSGFSDGYSSIMSETNDPPFSDRKRLYDLFVHMLLFKCNENVEYNKPKALAIGHSLTETLSKYT